MKTATTVCGKCGAEIPADARQGACPACLLETGLGLLTDEPVAGVDGDPGLTGITDAGYSAPASKDAWRLWRLRIAGGNRPGWPGRSLPRATEKPQPHRRTQSDRLRPLGHGSAPEALPSRSRSRRQSRASMHRPNSRSRRARWLLLLQHEIHRGRPA